MELHQKTLKKLGYTVEKSLGEGGQYFVYLTTHDRRGRCAVRVYQKHVKENLEQLPREVQDELKLAKKMGNNPNFVTLIDYFIENNALFTVWNYAPHGTLKDKICSTNPLTQKECLAYLTRVAKGLDQLHKEVNDGNGGSHGDIKPENLFLDDPESAIIGDLGLARLNESSTIRKTVMGTPAYCLPGEPPVAPAREQKNSIGAPSRERDIFSFAVTYAELRLGRHPYGTDEQEIERNLRSNSPNLDGLSKHEIEQLTAVLLPKPKIDSVYKWLVETSKLPEPLDLTRHRLYGKFRDAATKLEDELKNRFRTEKISIRSLVFKDLVRMEDSLKHIQEEVIAAIDVRNALSHKFEHGCTNDQIQNAIETLIEATLLIVKANSQAAEETITFSTSKQKKSPRESSQSTGNLAGEGLAGQVKPHEVESNRVSTDIPKWILHYPRDVKSAQAEKYGAIVKSELSETMQAAIPVLFFAYGLSPEQILKVTNLPDTLRENMESFLLSICRESNGKSLEEKWNIKRRELLEATWPDWINSYKPTSRIPEVGTKTKKEIERQFFELNDSPGMIRRAFNLPTKVATRIGGYLAYVIAEIGGRDGDLASKWGQAKGEYLLRHLLSGASVDESFLSKYCKLDSIPTPEAVSTTPKLKATPEPPLKPKEQASQSKGGKKKKSKSKGSQQKIDVTIQLEEAFHGWKQKKWKNRGLTKLTKSEKERLKKIILSASHPRTVKSFCQATEINEAKALSVIGYTYQFILSQGGKGLTFNERLAYCKSPRSDQAENEPQAKAKTPVSSQSSPYPYQSQKGNRKKSRSLHQRLRASYTLAFTSHQKMTVRVAFLSITDSLNWPTEELVFQKTHQLAKSYPHLFHAIPQKHAALIGPYVNSYLKAKGWQKSNSSAWNSAVAETRKTISAKQGVNSQQVDEIMQPILSWEKLIDLNSQDAHNGTEGEELAFKRKTESKSFSDWHWPSKKGFSCLVVTLLSWLIIPKDLCAIWSNGWCFHLNDCMLILGYIVLITELMAKPPKSPILPLPRKWQSHISAGFMLLAFVHFAISGFSMAARFQNYQRHKVSILIQAVLLVASLLILFGVKFNTSRKD